MKRLAQADICTWYKNKNRKPLVIRGARQVGKSTLVRLAAKELEVPLYEINLEKKSQLNEIFAALDVRLALKEFESVLSMPIDTHAPGILFLDEIQATPKALALLRYFYEEMPELAVISAGSLLEFALSEGSFSMPVGRIEYLFLGPLTFTEFLAVKKEDYLINLLNEYKPYGEFPEAAHEKCLSLLRDYCLVGGMPEAIVRYIETGSTLTASLIQSDIIETFCDDFAKYTTGKSNLERIRRVYDFIPTAIGEKFKYVKVNALWKAADIKSALDLLVQAGIVHCINHTDGVAAPLGAQRRDDIFKPLFLDVGLMNNQCGVRSIDHQHIGSIHFVNNGPMAEQFVGQHMLYAHGYRTRPTLFYWLREGKKNNAEVDYLVSIDTDVVPIEVKAGAEGSLKSLHLFMASRERCKLAVRFNVNRPLVTTISQPVTIAGGESKQTSYTLCSLPLYMVEQTSRIAGELLQNAVHLP